MPGITPLSTGCLELIIGGQDYDKPILQILSAKKIAGSEGTERYRLLVSDGKHLNSFAMLGTQLNDQYAAGKYSEFTIVRVDRFITSTVNKSDKGDKRVIIFLELTVLHPGTEVGKKIGNPVVPNPDAPKTTASEPKPNNPQSKPSTSYGNTGSISNGSGPSNSFANQNKPKQNLISNDSITLSTQDISHSLTHPIASLSPYQNKWVIKVRVTSKGPIRTWSNAKGEGKLFSMDLMDESGEIRATAFRDSVDKFYDLIEVDKVYYISKCQLKPANKQYSTLNNDYEMTLTSETVIQLCEEDESGIPQTHYNLIPISKIAEIEPKAVVDVIGVCKEASELQVFTGKTNNREFKKRDLTLVDTSNASIQLTIWGDEAVNFDGYVQPIILVKGARVTEFGGGKTLSLGNSSVMKINPDIPEGHKLRGWFDNGGADNISSSLSSRVPGAGGSLSTEWLTFFEASRKNLGSGDKPDYFQTVAIVHMIRDKNSLYKACPQTDCNKKVVDEGNGYYRCEKCNATFPNFKYRLLVNMNLGDWTSNRWATCFSDVAEQLLGKSANEIGEAIENNPDAAAQIFSSIDFKDFIFKLRTKIELFGDTQRNKYTIMSASPINYKEYNKYLIKNLQELTGIGKK